MMRACVVILLVVPLLALASCEEDCPTCPGTPVSDYDVYLGGYPNAVYVYNTKEMALVDSLSPVDPSGLHNLVVSADGRYLLLAYGLPEPGGLLIYDLETGDTVKNRPFGTGLEVSNTGKYIVHSIGYQTDFLDGSTFETIFSLPFAVGNGRFSPDDNKYYCIFESHYVRIYDMKTQTLDTTFMYVDNEGRTPFLYRMQPDARGRKFYFAVGYQTDEYYLSGYSLDRDSTTLAYPIGPPVGDLKITPDGKQIIYSDAGDVSIPEPVSMHVIYVDPVTDAIISLVEAGHALQGQPPTGMMPGLFAITPDSRYTVVASAGGAWAFGMIDNNQHRFVDLNVFEPQTISFVYATCQKHFKKPF